MHKKAKLLSLEQRRSFQLLYLMYLIIYACLLDLLPELPEPNSRLKSTMSVNTKIVPFIKEQNYGNYSFAILNHVTLFINSRSYSRLDINTMLTQLHEQYELISVEQCMSYLNLHLCYNTQYCTIYTLPYSLYQFIIMNL